MGLILSESDFYEVKYNDYGFPQTFQQADGTKRDHPVCACCHAAVMPNRGQGTACDACQHEFLLECQHDDGVF